MKLPDADASCIWPRALSRCHLLRMLRERKRIQRGRYALWLAMLLAAHQTLWRG